MSTTLLSLFSEVSDPRRRQGQMYPLPTILLYTVLAILAGAKSYRQVHGFIDTHIPVAAFRIQVWRVTRIIVLIRWAQPVPARASPTAKTSVVRFS